GTAAAIPTTGEAMEDWQLLVAVAKTLGAPLPYTSAADVRADIAARFQGARGLEGIASLGFNKPIKARPLLQASNPSERWKWDFMFQDLPPVKGTVDPSSLPSPPGVIPLKEVK